MSIDAMRCFGPGSANATIAKVVLKELKSEYKNIYSGKQKIMLKKLANFISRKPIHYK